jgi:hypothetical protein
MATWFLNIWLIIFLILPWRQVSSQTCSKSSSDIIQKKIDNNVYKYTCREDTVLVLGYIIKLGMDKGDSLNMFLKMKTDSISEIIISFKKKDCLFFTLDKMKCDFDFQTLSNLKIHCSIENRFQELLCNLTLEGTGLTYRLTLKKDAIFLESNKIKPYSANFSQTKFIFNRKRFLGCESSSIGR